MAERHVDTFEDMDAAKAAVRELAETFARMGLGKTHGVRRIKRRGVWWVMVDNDKEERAPNESDG